MSKSGIDYRPEIDGLRAVAVIPVILFHSGLKALPGGFLGVDVFFVISGFLITLIIKRELNCGSFTFVGFWARRIRRILPALIFVTACTLTVTYAFVFRPEQQAIGRQALAALLSIANFHFWQTTGDYWGNASEQSPFLHAWSLSVEEQFYLLFPVVLWLIARYRPRRLNESLAAAMLLSFLLFLWGTTACPVAAFYMLPFRVWELGAGCLLGVAIGDDGVNSSRFAAFGIVGLGLILMSYVFIEQLGTGIVLPVVGTVLVLAFGHVGPCRVALGFRPLVHIGKVSYSLYLWHWPVLSLSSRLGLECPGPFDKVVLLSAIYLLALVTYKTIEEPFRRGHRIVPRILLSGTAVAGAALAMAAIPRLYDTSEFNEARWINYSPRPMWAKWEGPHCCNIVQENPGYTPDALVDGGIRIGNRSVEPALVIVGNSHAEMWSDAVATIARHEGIEAAFFPQCGEQWFETGFDRDTSYVYRFIAQWKPRVILVALDWRGRRESDIQPFLEFAATHGAKVLLVEDPPWLLPCGDRSAVQWLASQGFVPRDGVRQYVPLGDEAPNQGGRRLVRELAQRYDFTRMVPVHDLFVLQSEVLVLVGRDAVYIDDDHLSSVGAHLALPRLREAIMHAMGEFSDLQRQSPAPVPLDGVSRP